MKKIDNVIRDYVSKLSIEELKFLNDRFSDRIGPDLAECAEFVSKASDIDIWLKSALSGDQLYDMLDVIHAQVQRELSHRIPDVVQV